MQDDDKLSSTRLHRIWLSRRKDCCSDAATYKSYGDIAANISVVLKQPHKLPDAHYACRLFKSSRANTQTVTQAQHDSTTTASNTRTSLHKLTMSLANLPSIYLIRPRTNCLNRSVRALQACNPAGPRSTYPWHGCFICLQSLRLNQLPGPGAPASSCRRCVLAQLLLRC